ncbi:hypothetical protein FMJ53_00475 [Klebsiella michiganensis]|nr:hypothetical protein [Klebsiella michiganensis]
MPGKRTLGICWSIQVRPGTSGPTLHFPGARALKCGAKNNKKSSHSSPINSKKNSINFFRGGFGRGDGFCSGGSGHGLHTVIHYSCG